MTVSYKVAATPQQASFSTLTAPAITVPSTTSGMVIAFLYIDNSATPATITGDTMKIGGTSMTGGSSASLRYNWGTANEQYIDLWAILQSNGGWVTGSTTIVWNCTNGSGNIGYVLLGAACFDGVNQTSVAAALTGFAGNTATTSGTGTTTSTAAITTAIGDAVVGYYANFTGDYTSGGGGSPGQTGIYADNNFATTAAEYNIITSGTSQTMTYTLGGTGGLYHSVGASITAAATASSCSQTLTTLGVGCGISMIGWTPALLRSPIPLLGGAALRHIRNLRRKPAVSRREFLLGHNGDPKLDN